MKKTLFTILIICFSFVTNGQTEPDHFCKEKIILLNEEFTELETQYKLEEKAFIELKEQITSSFYPDKLSTQLKEKSTLITKLKDSLNKSHETFLSYKKVCQDNGVKEVDINSWYESFNFKIKDLKEKKEEPEEKVIYTYFGKDQVIKENFIDKTTTEGRILNEVLSSKNKASYFGDITIPKENQEFNFLDNDFDIISNKTYKFKKIDIEIKDGLFSNIRVTIEYKGNLHIYENHVGISFLKFAKNAKKNSLFYVQTTVENSDFNLKEMRKLRLRVGDLLIYNYKIGNNYIPHDLVIELPAKDENNKSTNLLGSTTYQIKQETDLDKLLEIRAYTDFLALFGESSNGLVQIEAKAKFYLLPFPMQIGSSKGQLEIFKSISPYTHYSRYEENNRFIDASSGDIKNNLDLIERRFLTMGLEANTFEFQHKDAPIKLNLFSNVNYQLTEIKDTLNQLQNVKAFSYGFGIGLKSKRFNHFGFEYKTTFSWYDYKNFNTIENINLPSNIPVIKSQTEVFYHPSEKNDQAIFARLSTFNFMGGDDNQAFYQFQFGYKFAIGSRAVKK